MSLVVRSGLTLISLLIVAATCLYREGWVRRLAPLPLLRSVASSENASKQTLHEEGPGFIQQQAPLVKSRVAQVPGSFPPQPAIPLSNGSRERLREHCDTDLTRRILRQMIERPSNKMPEINTYCQKNKGNKSLSAFVDKFRMKSKVLEWEPEGVFVAKDLAMVKDPAHITLELLQKLPSNYFFKANHGSGMIVRVGKDRAVCAKEPCGPQWPKKGVNLEGGTEAEQNNLLGALRKACEHWLTVKYYQWFGEQFYEPVEPVCFFEEVVQSSLEGGPEDLKFFLFGGKPIFAQQDTKRARRRATAQGNIDEYESKSKSRQLLSTSGALMHGTQHQAEAKRFLQQCRDPALTPGVFLTKEALARAVEMAKRMGARVGAEFMRVDFMVMEREVFAFTEITFASAACHTSYSPMLLDRLCAWGINHPAEALPSECIASIATYITCDNSRPGSGKASTLSQELHKLANVFELS